MLPLPLLQSDVTLRTSAYEGYNDNVVEVATATGSERRGSPFTGVELQLKVERPGRASMHSVLLTLRGQHYTPLGGSVGGDDGGAFGSWVSKWSVSPRETFAVVTGGGVGTQNGSRQTENVSAADPTSSQRTLASGGASFVYRRELSVDAHLIGGAGVEARETLADASATPATRGLDLVTPSASLGVGRALSLDDRVETGVDVRLNYLPRLALDPTTGSSSSWTWQTKLTGSWGHTFDATWGASLGGGAQLSSVPGDPSGGTTVTPVVLAEGTYSHGDLYGFARYALGWAVLSPTLGPGMSHSINLQLGGPIPRTLRRLVFVASAGASQSSIPAGDTDLRVRGAGVGFLVRWSLNPWLGVLAGTDARWVYYQQLATSETSFRRDQVFVGLSGSFSTNPGELGLEVPRAPMR